MHNMNSAGMGHAIGWNAGRFVLMEQTIPGDSSFGLPPSMGNTSNTYHGTSRGC
jgi:hypothetical protein